VNSTFEKLFGELVKRDFNKNDYLKLAWTITNNELTNIKYMWNKILS